MHNKPTNRSLRVLASSVAVAVVLAISGLATNPPAQADPGGNGKGNHYGLVMVDAAPTVPRNLPDDPYGAAGVVANNNPDDFGYPIVVDGTVTLPAVSATAIAMAKTNGTTKAKQLINYSNNRKIKAGELPPPTVDVSKGLAHVNVVASPTTRTINQMLAFNDQVFDFASSHQFADAGVISSGIDGNAQILLMVRTLTDSLAAAIAEQFGTDTIVVQESPGFVSTTDAGNRNQDATPYKGGAMIYTPGYSCSSGFIWSISADQQGMVTAGHCIPNGGTVSIPNISPPIGSVPANWSQVNWTAGTGTHYLAGQSTYRGDLALVTLSINATSVGPTIYRGGPGSTTTATVSQMWSTSPLVGDQYCTGGVTTGELCGWKVTKVGIDHTYDNGEIVRHITEGTRSGSGVDHGDSGGPVYTVLPDQKTVAAKGIISGMATLNVLGFVTYYNYFTDINDAYYGLPGTLATDSAGRTSVYRLYNPNTGEHFSTTNLTERSNLVLAGWNNENIGWTAPTTSIAPVYRLYNPNAGDHFYTASPSERDSLTAAGWHLDGIAWYSNQTLASQVPIYRAFNPNAKTGAHNFTTSLTEQNTLVSLGWRNEGIAMYAATA